MTLYFGKLPAKRDSRDLLLASYLDDSKLPKIPATFGHQTAFPRAGWGMLGNDEFGDCAIAGPAHETMLWTKLGGHYATFTTAGVLSDYSAITGFDPHAGPPGENPTDQGSNVRDVARYRQTVGMKDAHGRRHKIGAYVALDPRNEAHVRAAVYLFDGIGLGFMVPDSAMEQFNAGEPWDVVPGAQIEGGHYVPIVGVTASGPVCVTWGRVQGMTWDFFGAYADESYAYLSTEALTGGKSPEGFDVAALKLDLAAVRG